MKHLIKYFFPFILICSMFNSTAGAQASKGSLKVGDTMPAFSLKDQDGKAFNSADYVGKSMLVIYFYPKDESMVCTKEACAFRDSFGDFIKAGAKVIGINGGSVASHKAFAQNHQLPFILLSDPGDQVYKLFGVKSSFFISGRKTFIVDLKGKVVYTHDAMLEGKGHVDESLKFLTTGTH